MRTWLLLGCLLAGIALLLTRSPLSAGRPMPPRLAPGHNAALRGVDGGAEIRRLPDAAAITGRVVDRRNRIVARARVGIEEVRREGGAFRIVRADSLGRFRIGLLPPGRYRITADLDPASTPFSSTPNNRDGLRGRILTVRNRAEAAPGVVVIVEVEAGEELSDVQVLIPTAGRALRLALT
jgi:hypothetical protein